MLGAGYLGIFAALELRQQLNQHNLHNTSVRILAHSFPKGISSLLPDCREPALDDNYGSQIAGGWIMPVCIGPLKDHQQWNIMVREAQAYWHRQSDDPLLSLAIKPVRSLMFHRNQHEKDKSGTLQVNLECPPPLFPQSQCTAAIFGHSLNSPSSYGTSRYSFQGVDLFDHIIQVETTSVLLHYAQSLLTQNVPFEQLPHCLSDFNSLKKHFKPNTRTIVINASGDGACALFNGPPTHPVRGDLVNLRIPLQHIPPHQSAAAEYSYWAGSHYVFLRYELDRPWLQLILGGTFLENDNSLSVRPQTLREILNFWLDMFHLPPDENPGQSYVDKKARLIDRLIQKML